MASNLSVTGRLSIRAALARHRLDNLKDNEILFVDRLGPRILRVPQNPTVRLSRETLRALDRGELSGLLARGTRILASRLLKCQDIAVDTNGQYTVQKLKDPGVKESPIFTIRTLNVWTGRPGELQPHRNINDLIFYSVSKDLLPSYHSWQNDRLERRESSVEFENQMETIQAELNFEVSSHDFGVFVDEQNEKFYADLDRKASSDPENKLHYKPNIVPSDPAWQGVEEYFQWVLDEERNTNPEPRTLKVIGEEFVHSQKLLAIPTRNNGYRGKIQGENTAKYHEALVTIFRGKPDNLVTKLSMLCFGLPIEPLTFTNVKFAGGAKDVPAEHGESEPGVEMVERIQWVEKPLEFWDSYNERSYRYPIIRMKKRKYEEIDSETAKEILAMAKERAKRPAPDVCCFSSWARSARDLHLRGGTGIPNPRNRIWLYTDVGKFSMDDDREAFVKLASRLLRLENVKFQCQIDLIPVDDIDAEVQNITGEVLSFTWTSARRNNLNYDSIIAPKRENPHRFQLRIRHAGHGDHPFFTSLEGIDPWQPAAGAIMLEMEEVGAAYWRVPSDDFSKLSVNEHQALFLSAIKYLLPNHIGRFVKWKLSKAPSSNGEIYLSAKVPPVELYKAVDQALDLAREAGDTGRITVLFEEIPDDVNNEREKVRIFIPGCNEVGWYRRFPEADYVRENIQMFDSIREFVLRQRPGQGPIRFWSGLEHYESGNVSKSMLLSRDKDSAADTDIWRRGSLAWTVDGVVVQPEITALKIIDVRNVEKMGIPNPKAKSLIWKPAGGSFSLADFRQRICRMFKTYAPMGNSICIEQPSTSHSFVIQPDMTEHQWQFQVFNWLNPPDIHVRHMRTTAPIDLTQVGTTGTGNAQSRGYKEDTLLHLEKSKTEWEKYHQKAVEQEQLRIDAYTRDESLFRRRRRSNPEIPMFGPPFEDNIPAGSRFPQLFISTLTANDSALERLLSRHRQNIILDREDFCSICRTTLKAGPHNQEARERHFQEHRDPQVNASGNFSAFAPGSENAHDDLFETLLSQAVGNLQENGESHCYFSGCSRRFNSAVNKINKANHFLKHVNNGDVQKKPCPIPDCSQDLAALGEAEFQDHLVNHLDFDDGVQHCPYKGCGYPFNFLRQEEIQKHLIIHTWDRCHLCDEKFSGYNKKLVRVHYFNQHIQESEPTSTEFSSSADSEPEEPIEHAEPIEPTGPTGPLELTGSGHPSEDTGLCPWPGCFQIFSAPTEEDIKKHILTHWASDDISPKYKDAGTTVQSPPPTRPSATSTSTASASLNEDQNNIPKRLRDAHPGMNFYCPMCLTLVSGKNASPCRRHRIGGCKVEGNENWLIMTAKQMVQRKAQDRQDAGTAKRGENGKKASPRKKASYTAYKDTGGEEDTDDDNMDDSEDENGGEGALRAVVGSSKPPPAEKKGKGKGKRKKDATFDPETKMADNGPEEGPPAKKPRKKKAMTVEEKPPPQKRKRKPNM